MSSTASGRVALAARPVLRELDEGIGEVVPEEALGLDQGLRVVEFLESVGGARDQLLQLRGEGAVELTVQGFDLDEVEVVEPVLAYIAQCLGPIVARLLQLRQVLFRDVAGHVFAGKARRIELGNVRIVVLFRRRRIPPASGRRKSGHRRK